MQAVLSSIDRAFAENVLGPMEWEKWNVLFDEVSQQFALVCIHAWFSLSHSVLIV